MFMPRGGSNRLTNTISDDTGPLRTETYGYDELSRLTSVNYGDGQTQTYSFDTMGNRLQKADSVHGTENYTYNAANMLLTRGANAYTNDVNGNTLTGGGRTNTWDGQNRLTQCVYNGTTTTHTYGSDGLRRRTVEGATTTDYVLDGQGVVRTLVNNVVDRTYLHGARGPEYERIGANDPVWYLYDGLGSVLGTVDKNGTVVSTRKYDVYGAVRGSTGPSGTKHKFVGSLGHPSEDETGLVYMRARYMDPVTGRFLSEDPAADGNNWYIYCRNSPVILSDPSGLAPWVRIPGSQWEIRIEHDQGDNTDHVHWRPRGGADQGAFFKNGHWKHNYGKLPPNAVKKHMKGKGWSVPMGLSTVQAHFEADPLDFFAILLDAAGEHDLALKLDYINGSY